jgi:hypothetical protein
MGFLKTNLIFLGIFLILLNLGCFEEEKVIEAPISPEITSTPPPVESQQPIKRPGEVEIRSILENPEKFDGSEVTISGICRPGLAFEFVDEQPYLIDDGTGEIWVITMSMVPAQGEFVTVRGVVVVPYQIKGRHYDVAIIEGERIE